MHSAFRRTSMPSSVRMPPNRIGDVVVFAIDQARPFLDDGDLAAEAAEHLAELEADVAAADDDQMSAARCRGPVIELLVRYGTVVDALERRHRGPRPDVDEDAIGLQSTRRRPAPRARR